MSAIDEHGPHHLEIHPLPCPILAPHFVLLCAVNRSAPSRNPGLMWNSSRQVDIQRRLGSHLIQRSHAATSLTTLPHTDLRGAIERTDPLDQIIVDLMLTKLPLSE